MKPSSPPRPAERLLVVDDEEASRKALRALFTREGWTVTTAANGREALEAVRAEPVDLVVSDLNMPEMDGLEFLRAFRKENALTPVLIVTAFDAISNVIRAMEAGADDVLGKPYDVATLLFRVRKALEFARLAQENVALAGQGRTLFVVGTTPGMTNLMRRARAAARTNAPVLVLGESGTGKELLARHIHALSPRADKPFVVVFCGALPEALVESELFGHERGAYTGADRARKGLVEEAEGGTVFFDEIGELAPAVQVKLLRLLQENEFRRLGSTETVSADVRVLAATNRLLENEVAVGRFREDLYFRLNVVCLRLPPVRERREDIPLLLEHFRRVANREYGKGVGGFEPDVIKRLLGAPWPGNIREIENRVRRLVIMSSGRTITLADLEAEGAAPGASGSEGASGLSGVAADGTSSTDLALSAVAAAPPRPMREEQDEVMDRFLRAYFHRVLTCARGNVSAAARMAKKDRRDFVRLMQRLGISAAPYRRTARQGSKGEETGDDDAA